MLKVTTINVTSIPVDLLTTHLSNLRKRKLKASGARRAELQKEMELVFEQLKSLGVTAHEQTELAIPYVEKQEYASLVENSCREHYRKRVRMQKLINERTSISNTHETKISATYNNAVVMTGFVSSKVEQALLLKEERITEISVMLKTIEKEIRPMETALELLNYDERQLIEAKLYHNDIVKDFEAMSELYLTRYKFYELKRSAYLKLATYLKYI